MARRRKAQLPAAAWIDWSPQVASLFGEMGPLIRDLNPPSRARIFYGLRHLTLIARFTNAEGVHATVKVKVMR